MKVAESVTTVKPAAYRSAKEVPVGAPLPKLTVVRRQDARKENFHGWSMPKVQSGYLRAKKNDLL